MLSGRVRASARNFRFVAVSATYAQTNRTGVTMKSTPITESLQNQIVNETLLKLEQARSEFPGRNRLGLSTLHRWRLKGVRGVRLETCLIGGQRFTSQEAIERFIAAQNAADEPVRLAITATQRARQAEAAQQALKAAGM